MQKRKLQLDLHVKGAFQHALSCSDETNMDSAIQLIQKDAEKHHLFFNDEGFHNHLVHQLLADYSLGADQPRLQKSYDDNAVNQRPKRPKKDDFVWDSPHCVGNEDYYASYVDFFQEAVQQMGAKRCIEYYIFEQDPSLRLYSRFLAGVYHPLIHLGYGIEFNHPLMLAEGLAWVIVHQPRSWRFYESIHANKSLSSKQSLNPLDIIENIYQDSRLDGLVQWTDDNKYTTVTNKASHILQEYCQQWPVSESLDGEHGLRMRATQLQILTTTMYAGSHRPGQKIMLDFFLMHTLTSSLFLHAYIELLDPSYAASILRGKFAADIAWYIARGRPLINLDQYSHFDQKSDCNTIISKAIASQDDHVPKVVRALIHASRYDKNSVIAPEIYQAIADFSVNEKLVWGMDAIGFDEAW